MEIFSTIPYTARHQIFLTQVGEALKYDKIKFERQLDQRQQDADVEFLCEKEDLERAQECVDLVSNYMHPSLKGHPKYKGE